MKRNLLKVLVIVFTIISIVSCKSTTSKDVSKLDGIEQYIKGYTTGVISSRESIRIILNNDTQEKEGSELRRGILSFEPKVKGKAYWLNSHEIEFVPESEFINGVDYVAKLKLSEIITVSKDFKSFVFPFTVIKQSLSIHEDGLKQYSDGKHMKYIAKLVSADYLSKEKVENILKVENAKDLNWSHSVDGRTHTFVIDSILKTGASQFINIEWDGSAYNIKDRGNKKIEIPAKGEFFVIDVLPVKSNNKQFKIVFSDAIDAEQDLRGLIRLESYSNLRFNVSSNEVIIYTNNTLTRERVLHINSGIKSVTGEVIKESQKITVMFEEIKPAVKFIGKGVITPSDKGFIVPFAAVSVKSVDLRVIKIYSNNIHQFLQDNRFDRSNNLKKVGRLVLQKNINLDDGVRDLKKWNDYRLNLADLMEVDKSAIYRLELKFRIENAIYKGIDSNVEETIERAQDWDNPGWYSDYYYPNGYNWRDRENPSTISYYNSSHFASKNVFASNLGVIAKRGSDKSMLVYVSELTTTNSVDGAVVEAYTYQNQLISTAKTDNQGFAELQLANKPFLITVSKNDDKAYLRVDDGSSLSISNFDVSGERIQKGLKGYIYGERGVWRPGDNIHVSFILEDKQNTLPSNHPIIAKLYNSRGQLVKKLVQKTTDKCINSFLFVTDKDAPTGNWRVEIQIGGATFSKRLKVETIKPNRLKINMSIKGDIIKTGTDSKLNIKSAWLHGAKAPNLKVDVKMDLSTKRTTFKGYSNYRFDDYAKNFWFDERQIFNGKTNEKGELNVNIPKKRLKNASGLLKASFVTRIFEKSGDFSISGKSFTFSPFSSYVGMQLPSKESDWYKTNKNYKLDVVSISENGDKLNRNLTVELFKVGWRWWWDSNDRDLASYVNRRYNKNVTTKYVKTINGKGHVNISASKYGRYYLKVTDKHSGHSCGQTLYFSEWGGFDVSNLPGGASILALSLEKSSYKVGEDIVVNIPSSKTGKALVSIESGIKVIDKFIINTEDKRTQFRFKATEDMSPNVYVNVSLIQEHQNTDNDHPMRLYGVIPVKVENPKTIITPIVNQANELRPDKEFSVSVSEKDGREMSYTIAVVDEGLLDITSYNTPNPHSVFYARESLGVKTWDMYDYVLGAYGARLENAFAIGGDAALKGKNKKRTNRFKPVVLFKGPFKLKKGETVKHSFMMPNYIGAVRTMVIAADNGAYGSASVRSEVKKPLMLLATLPRVLNPVDKIKLPVTLFVMDKKIKDVDVDINISDNLKIVGNSKQTVHFNSTGEKIAEFELEVTDKIGKGVIGIHAGANGEKASFETDIDIRVPNPPITNISEQFVEEGESKIIDIKNIGIEGTNSAMMELSVLPAINLSKRLSYLIDYPHGCLEQTVSGAFPQLFLSKLTNLTAEQKRETMDNINACISRLMSFQTVDGGFTYWSGGRYINEWANVYAGHFLITAEKEGYSVPATMKRKWLRFQKTMANNWNDYSKYYNSELVQAYRLYVLALAGEENIGAMNRMREKENTPHIAIWRLASAYAVAGRTKVADKLINNLSINIADYKEWGNTFGSSLRDKSMILESLILMGKKADAFKLVMDVSKRLGSNEWLSTQTIAYSLCSICNYADEYNKGESYIKCNYIINGNKNSVLSKVSVLTTVIDINSLKLANIKIENIGENSLFVRVINKGIPLKYEETHASDKLKMTIVYRDSNGKIINPENIKQGTDFVAEINVRNSSYSDNYENLALTCMFPTGWEIANTRLFDGKQTNKANYIDIRDDRVNFYFSLRNKKSTYFKVNLNASYKGEYYMPAITCEAMYDNDIRAVVAGKKVIVQ